MAGHPGSLFMLCSHVCIYSSGVVCWVWVSSSTTLTQLVRYTYVICYSAFPCMLCKTPLFLSWKQKWVLQLSSSLSSLRSPHLVGGVQWNMERSMSGVDNLIVNMMESPEGWVTFVEFWILRVEVRSEFWSWAGSYRSRASHKFSSELHVAQNSEYTLKVIHAKITID